MGLHHELPIYRDSRALLIKTISIIRNIPRDLKATLGKSLLDGVSDFSRLIMHANIAMGDGKVPHLDELLTKLEVIQFQFRALAEMGVLPRTHHADVIELMASIGAQAGGWKKGSISAPVNGEQSNVATPPVQSSLRL